MTITAEDARRLTERIVTLLENAHAAATTLRAAIADAHERQVHIALGYPSFGAYVQEEFKGRGTMLDRGPRQAFVLELAELGMSTRAIAPVVGMSKSQVIADTRQLRQVTNDWSTDRSESEGVDEPRIARVVTGLDGKNYSTVSKTREAVRDRVERMRQLANEGHSSQQIAEAVGLTFESARNVLRDNAIDVPADLTVGGTRKHDANRIVAHIVMDAENLTADTRLINFSDLDPASVPAWIESLTKSRKALTQFIGRLEREIGR